MRRAGRGADEEHFLALGRVEVAIGGFFRRGVFAVVDSAVVDCLEGGGGDVERRGKGRGDGVVDDYYAAEGFYGAEGVERVGVFGNGFDVGER